MKKGGIKIKTSSPRSKFVAISVKNKNRVIAEGTTVDAVVKKAEKSGQEYSMMYIPRAGKTYIY